MARVTVEDCLESMDNRFELVLVASKRARQVANGSEPFVEWENDKPTVVALREIAEGHVTRKILEARPVVEFEAPAEQASGEEVAAEPQAPEQGSEAQPGE